MTSMPPASSTSPMKDSWYHQARRRAYEVLEVAREGDRLSRGFDLALAGLILLNVLAVVLETEPAVARRFGGVLQVFEIISVGIFTIEYLARLWSCTASARFAHPVTGRVRFAFQPLIIIDLLAILPAFLPMVGVDGRFLRALRLLRVLRVMKLGRYSSAIQLMGRVFRAKAPDLAVVIFALSILLLIAASMMYFFEHEAQPEHFPSIPAALWWGVATLTTVGYGDVVPVTVMGRVFGGVMAVLGIGLFALPAGLLAGAFSEELARRDAKNIGDGCPHCGQPLPGGEQASVQEAAASGEGRSTQPD